MAVTWHLEGRRLLGSLILCTVALGCADTSPERSSGVGVSLAGPEFGAEQQVYSSTNPGLEGREYVFPSDETISWFRGHGAQTFRLPLAWERLQPVLGGELDAKYLARTLSVLDEASERGAKVVLDLHSYGRYRLGLPGDGREVLVLDGPAVAGRRLTAEHLSDLWLRLSARVAGHPGLRAYGLMNEPHDMQGGDWHAVSRQVVTTLRQRGDSTWVWVAGDGWSKASEWQLHNPPQPWIEDPLKRCAYEAHVYFDTDASGRYSLSFARELALDPQTPLRGRSRVEPFLDWCERGGVPGVIGEFGLPWHDAAWHPVLMDFLALLSERGVESCAWAGGDWWGDYPLSLQPRSDVPRELMQALFAR